MVELGRFAVFLALGVSVWAAVAALVGIRTGRPEPVRSAEGALKAAAVALTVAAVALVEAFVSRDFSVQYVADYSSRSLSLFYTVAAFWAGHSGSLLLWAWVLSLCAVGVVHQNRSRNRELMPWVVFVLAITTAFFVLLIAFPSNPFRRLPFVPVDGNGLNPLLQNYGQMLHPVTMYLGYVGFTVPFAFCIAALATGRLTSGWTRVVRHWTLWSWLMLTAGILFGARWAYVELGWGGYWAWDPVENASLMPWLTGTAYLHSVMIEERKGMLRVWNVSLAVATFALCIFGTFLVRSGVVSSVHAFGESSVGRYLIVATIVTVLASGLLIVARLPQLRTKAVLESALSREATFLANNLLFVAMAFAVFWGTVFPLVADAVRGSKVSVGPPFFEAVIGPIGIALLALLGVCPLIAWRKASAKNLRRNFLLPLAVGLVAFSGYVLLADEWRRGVAVVVGLGAFVTATVLAEVARGTRARRRVKQEPLLTAMGRLFSRNPRRYGGYVIHLGVVIAIVGIAVHMAYQTESRATVRAGESVTIEGYRIVVDDIRTEVSAAKVATVADLSLSQGSKDLGRMTTERAMYANQDQPYTRVGIRSTAFEDLYVILESADPDTGVASLRFLVNPAVFWIWFGAVTLLAGGLLVSLPARRSRREVHREAKRQLESPLGV